VPKTVVIFLLEHLQRAHDFEGIRLVLSHPPAPSWPRTRSEKELMPFPVLDAALPCTPARSSARPTCGPHWGSIFPEIAEEVLAGYVTRFVRLFMQSIYKWVRRPSACTSEISTWIASEPCNFQWFHRTNGSSVEILTGAPRAV